ncbi:MAG: Hpt domain-containing protein [Pseudomonadota bacterium]
MSANLAFGAGGYRAMDRPVLIDRDYLGELMADDLGDLAGALEDAARDDGDRGFSALDQAVTARDAAAAQAAAHALKGAGGSLGLTRFAAAAEEIMITAGAGTPPRADEIAHLRALWSDSLDAYRHFFRAGAA